MTEARASATFDMATSGQDDLLTTKLHEPRAQSGFVPARGWWSGLKLG